MNEEMRKEFEEWFSVSKISYFYGYSHKKAMQIAWQASREAMNPIKLPDATFETPSGDNALREDAVIDAIYAAGYKVAE